MNFSSRLQLTKKASWRNQEVNLMLRVPVGTHLKISRDLEWFLNGYNYWSCNEDGTAEFTEWIMTDTGLKCLNERKDSDNE